VSKLRLPSTCPLVASLGRVVHRLPGLHRLLRPGYATSGDSRQRVRVISIAANPRHYRTQRKAAAGWLRGRRFVLADCFAPAISRRARPRHGSGRCRRRGPCRPGKQAATCSHSTAHNTTATAKKSIKASTFGSTRARRICPLAARRCRDVRSLFARLPTLRGRKRRNRPSQSRMKKRTPAEAGAPSGRASRPG
jgi:hypothetical protein